MHCSCDYIDLFFNLIRIIETWSFSAFIRMNQNLVFICITPASNPTSAFQVGLETRWDAAPATQPTSLLPTQRPQACTPPGMLPVQVQQSPAEPQITCPVWQAGRVHSSRTATLETLLCSHLAHCLPCPRFTRPSSPGQAVPRTQLCCLRQVTEPQLRHLHSWTNSPCS